MTKSIFLNFNIVQTKLQEKNHWFSFNIIKESQNNRKNHADGSHICVKYENKIFLSLTRETSQMCAFEEILDMGEMGPNSNILNDFVS